MGRTGLLPRFQIVDRGKEIEVVVDAVDRNRMAEHRGTFQCQIGVGDHPAEKGDVNPIPNDFPEFFHCGHDLFLRIFTLQIGTGGGLQLKV